MDKSSMSTIKPSRPDFPLMRKLGSRDSISTCNRLTNNSSPCSTQPENRSSNQLTTTTIGKVNCSRPREVFTDLHPRAWRAEMRKSVSRFGKVILMCPPKTPPGRDMIFRKKRDPSRGLLTGFAQLYRLSARIGPAIAILATVARQEHARLSERVVAGLRRAKREGKVLGRKRIILDRERIRTLHAAGESVRAIAAKFGVSKSLVGNILTCE